jgi:hypothetical protein
MDQYPFHRIHYDDPPVYCPSIGDTVNVGSFVIIGLGQPSQHTRLVRILSNKKNQVVGCYFRCLFPFQHGTLMHTSSDPPVHSYPPVTSSPGCTFQEVYSTESLTRFPAVDINHVCFVFTPEEIQKGENAWASHIGNVFVCRFFVYRPTEKLLPVNQELPFCFPNQMMNAVGPTIYWNKRCLHQVVWGGLFLVKKQLLN